MNFDKEDIVLWAISRHGAGGPTNLEPWQPSTTRTSSPREPRLKQQRPTRTNGAVLSSYGIRWSMLVVHGSCARCWRKVSTWTRMTSRYCTGPDCTEFYRYPLADFLPFIESPPSEPLGLPRGFFWLDRAGSPGLTQILRNTRLIIVSSRLAGTRLDSSTTRCGRISTNWSAGSGLLHR
jgi:hypothetical protein